jgi:hypothetical protein
MREKSIPMKNVHHMSHTAFYANKYFPQHRLFFHGLPKSLKLKAAVLRKIGHDRIFPRPFKLLVFSSNK